MTPLIYFLIVNIIYLTINIAAHILAFLRINDTLNAIASTMLLIKDVFCQKNQSWYLSHIW